MNQLNSNLETSTEPPVIEPKTTRRRPNSFAHTIKRAVNMASGITEHSATLSPNGLNEINVQTLNTIAESCKTLENEQEILKGKLKEKTLELANKVEELKELLGRYALIIKATIPQKRWVDFGISAKR